jgi:myo-inositol-1(or 4)-monophosphatase
MRADWLAFCREVADDVGAVLRAYPTRDDREPVVGLGRGGDDTTVIDQQAEAAAVLRLQALEARGIGFLLVSEELGERRFGDPSSPWRVVLDPIDGSLNAKRGLPFFCISIAFANGPTLDDVQFGYVKDLGSGEEWMAEAGQGAVVDGRPLGGVRPKPRLGIVDLEATTTALLAEAARRLDGHVGRVRLLGALALALCQLADGRVDAVATLKPSRSVDLAAAALIVREAGATVETVDADAMALDLDSRSRMVAARDAEWAERLRALLYDQPSGISTLKA